VAGSNRRGLRQTTARDLPSNGLRISDSARLKARLSIENEKTQNKKKTLTQKQATAHSSS
jgi:hypothetical protein